MSRADPERELQLRDDDVWERCTIRTRLEGGGIDTLYTIQYIRIDRAGSIIVATWWHSTVTTPSVTVARSEELSNGS